MFLLYKYKPVCSIHNITYWLIKKNVIQAMQYLTEQQNTDYIAI